jgi:hypothetical protein
MRKPPIKVELKDPELLELISEEEEAWLNSLATAELAKDGSKYIATKRKQIVAIASSLGELYRQLNAKGIKNVRIRYIENLRFVVIYQ